MFQFRNAVPIAPGDWLLSERLRGQRGSPVADEWPIGSVVVLLDAAATLMKTSPEAIGSARHYRIGPARFPIDHPTYVHSEVTSYGIGYRPYAPAHLKVMRRNDADTFTWVRQTRIGGDRWEHEVPLGEQGETYVLRASSDGIVLGGWRTNVPTFALTADALGLSHVPVAYNMTVAQISDVHGPGMWASVSVS